MARKYNNDYSRFDQIEEEQDAPVEDTRDFYFDEKGGMLPVWLA